MDVLESFRSPWVVLSALPWVLLLAWVARRLLGAKRISLRTTLVTGVLGYACGLGTAVWLVEDVASPVFGLVAAGLTVGFIMVGVVALELVAVRGPVVPPVPRLRVPHPARTVRHRVAVAARLAEVTRLATRFGLAGFLGLEGRGDEDRDLGVGDTAVERSRRARRALEEAGGVFVKLGQLLSTRVDLFPPAAAAELARLQESAAPADAADVRRVLERDLGRSAEEAFDALDWEPIAAASLGQVYAARLHTGEEVVVKVQRPGIADVVDRDLAIVHRLARLAERRTAWARAYGVVALAKEFDIRLREELDYRVEAANAVEVARALHDEPRVHVPRVVEELSSRRVLVTERLRGVSAGQATLRGPARTGLADALLRAELTAMLSGGRFHADPHPGNVFVLEDGRLGLLDLGATGRLDAFERSSAVTMIAALRSRDPLQLRDALLAVASIPADLDQVALDRALARFMADHLDGGDAPDVGALVDVLAVTSRFGVGLPPSTTTMFRALVTLEGTLRTLDPEYDLMAATQRVGGDLVSARLHPAAVGAAARDEAARLGPVLLRAPYHLDRLAGLVERGELRMRTSRLSDPREAAVVSRLVNRALVAFLGAAVGGVSALLLLSEAGPVVAGAAPLAHVLGYSGLVAGAVLLLRVLLEVAEERVD